jgi:hypothetical protein
VGAHAGVRGLSLAREVHAPVGLEVATLLTPSPTAFPHCCIRPGSPSGSHRTEAMVHIVCNGGRPLGRLAQWAHRGGAAAAPAGLRRHILLRARCKTRLPLRAWAVCVLRVLAHFSDAARTGGG